MERIPEPELMDEAEQAAAYAAADFEAPHRRFIELFREAFPGVEVEGPVLDLGCGPGDITFRFARAFPRARLLGLDGAAAMLWHGRDRLAREPECAGRIQFMQARLPLDIPLGLRFPTIISNSLLHHLHDPRTMWRAIADAAAPQGRIFVVDLMRARDEAHARALTEAYAASEPEVLRRDFHHSLLAAFTPDEVQRQVREAGLPDLRVQVVSDRHLMVWGRA